MWATIQGQQARRLEIIRKNIYCVMHIENISDCLMCSCIFKDSTLWPAGRARRPYPPASEQSRGDPSCWR
jgi:hypothetical protein